jgi:hypothetical protein
LTLNWLFNSLVFWVIFNLSSIVTWYKTRTWPLRDPFLTWVVPLVLASVLTIVDSLRVYVILQIIILVAVGLALYWLYHFYYRGKSR